MLKLEDQYESSHYPGETLTVRKIYTPKMFSLKVGNTESTVMASYDQYDGAKLMLAHISREAMNLVRKTKEFTKW